MPADALLARCSPRRAPVPRRPARADARRRSRRSRVLEEPAREGLPPPPRDRRRASAPPWSCRRWCSATAGRRRAAASPSRAIPLRGSRGSSATTCQRPGRGRRRRRARHRAAPAQSAGARGRGGWLLERHHRDLCEVEFTVEDGASGSCRPASGSAAAAPRCGSPSTSSTRACSRRRRRSSASARSSWRPPAAPVFATAAPTDAVVRAGWRPSPGAAVGRVVFDPARAQALAGRRRSRARCARRPRRTTCTG